MILKKAATCRKFENGIPKVCNKLVREGTQNHSARAQTSAHFCAQNDAFFSLPGEWRVETDQKTLNYQILNSIINDNVIFETSVKNCPGKLPDAEISLLCYGSPAIQNSQMSAKLSALKLCQSVCNYECKLIFFPTEQLCALPHNLPSILKDLPFIQIFFIFYIYFSMSNSMVKKLMDHSLVDI